MGYYPYESYSAGPARGSFITFGIGFAVGPWLNYDCDWPRRKVCVGDLSIPGGETIGTPNGDEVRTRSSGYQVRNTVNVVNINSASARVWEPSAKPSANSGDDDEITSMALERIPLAGSVKGEIRGGALERCRRLRG